MEILKHTMATLQPQRIQLSLFLQLLVFLLHFSSLLFPLLAYNRPDKYFINCGSNSDVNENGQVYVGESNTDYPVTRFASSQTASSESSVTSSLYKTARIFRGESWYKFSIDKNGTYLVRLHFFASSSPARFNVSVPRFWLLRNFDAINEIESNSALVKEFFVHITQGSFKITKSLSRLCLRHLRLSMLLNFSYCPSISSAMISCVSLMEFIQEYLLTKAYDSFLINPVNAKNSFSYYGQIKFYVDDDSHGPNSNRYTAPSVVYGTAKVISNSSAINVLNITWSLPVDKNADHLLRLHFCDFLSRGPDLTFFNLLIYDSVAIQVNDDEKVIYQLSSSYYYDLVVHSDHSGLMNISVETIISVCVPNAFLNGLEIMKLIQSSDSVPANLEESNSKHLLRLSSWGFSIGFCCGACVFWAS
ncbi:hypothetical protein RJT34_30792 [Clitoria ternatea]|uniref:Malectin-like domain-containing protein n=1 Tax=Clitoria ternatea TaxID=43366 RepID=A0AAN9EXL8_CLITE